MPTIQRRPSPALPAEDCEAAGHLDTPSPEALSTALLLSELLQHLHRTGRHTHELIAAATGLRLGELRVLDAVADDTHDLPGLAARTGEVPPAVSATVTALELSDIVRVTTADRGPQTVHITERGRARLDQLAALRVRLLAEIPSEVAQPLLRFAQEANAQPHPAAPAPLAAGRG